MAEETVMQTTETTGTTETTVEQETKAKTQTEKMISKAQYDAKVKELNDARKKAEEALKSKMTDEEKAAAILAERDREFETVKKELDLMKYEKQFLANGYDAEVSASLANALSEGDIPEFLKIHNEWVKKGQEDFKKTLKTEIDNRTPAIKTNSETPKENKKEEPVITFEKAFAASTKTNMERANKILERYK